MNYGEIPVTVIIPLIATAYLLLIYLILTLVQRTIRITPRSTK